MVFKVKFGKFGCGKMSVYTMRYAIENDIRAAEVMNETQGQYHDRVQAGINYTKAYEEEQRFKNLERYGVDFDLRNPQTLEDRRSKANFWRCNNTFGLLADSITKKSEKFHELWNRYAFSNSEEERLQIVEQMEKMYPTKESTIRAVERKTGYRK